ncbi:transcriptional regulator [Kitasatospora sp. NPDC097691]|uniref:MmyB family transcriptional regulator n=1 Tax=Kitasatospora sp. NPDC097691 TaxID=3157231 RepID=UPI00332BE047
MEAGRGCREGDGGGDEQAFAHAGQVAGGPGEEGADPAGKGADRQQQRGEHQRVAVQHPLQAGDTSADVSPDRGQGDVDDDGAEGDDEEAEHRGHLAGASEEVLDAVANALRLDDAERAHLFDLARAAAKRPTRRHKRPAGALPDSVLRVLASMTGSPAFIRNGRLDTNTLGPRPLLPLFPHPTARTTNIARTQFLTPAGRDFFPDWEVGVNTTVALLRTEAGRAPHDAELTGLIGELVTRSEEFRTAWAKHNVRLHHSGRKAFHHPAVGDLTLEFDAMELPAQPGLTLTAYTAAPGTTPHLN